MYYLNFKTLEMKTICLFVLFLVTVVTQIAGHGRLVDPPQRGSLYRFPEYDWANPGHVADDNELICGTRAVSLQFFGK